MRDTKGTSSSPSAKMGSIKDRNGRDITEAEDSKKRGQEYTELYQKDRKDPENHGGVIIHLEPDILGCKVKWALGSIMTNKTSVGEGNPFEGIPQILKDDAVKVLHSICQQIWKKQQWLQDWKRSVFIPISKKDNVKESSNCCTVALISNASKAMLKILQARLQQYVNCEIPYVQASLRKGRGTRDQIVNICWIIEKAREVQENIYFCVITMPKLLTMWITETVGNSARDVKTRPPDPPLEKSVCRSGSTS